MFTPTKGTSPGKHPLSGLLGPQVNEWPYDNNALCKALELKSEQEITKQHFYKLELLKLSLQANIPSELIPSIFNQSRVSHNTNKNTDNNINNSPLKLPSPNSDVVMVNPNQQIKLQNFKFPPDPSPQNSPIAPNRNSHSQNDDITLGNAHCSNTLFTNSMNNNNNNNNNSHFRSHKRTNSPARIGAKAVEALNGNNSLNLTEEENENQTSPALQKSRLFDTTRITNTRNLSMNNTSETFTKSHRRIQSMPSILKPSPFAPELFSFKTHFQKSDTRSTLPQGQDFEMLETSLQNKRQHRRIHSTGVIDLDVINQPATYEVNKKFKFGSQPSSSSSFAQNHFPSDNSNNSNSTEGSSEDDLHENSTHSETTIEDNEDTNDSKSLIQVQQDNGAAPMFTQEATNMHHYSKDSLIKLHRRSNTLDSILN